tara:strand:- start:498 stop:1283 length:786 start_codon:yes stop_codon:yes gene_type:complete
MTIDRNQLIAEELIRDHIRKRISFKLEKQRLAEEKIRKAIRYLIEAETGTEEASRSTGINVLADLLEKIVPVIEDDYKMLTTSDDQRKSFRNHIIHAIENSLRPIESQNQGEQATENIEYEIDVDLLREKLSIDLDPEDDGKEEQSIEGEFIDIDNDGQEDDGFVQIEDQNETGRNFAAVTFRAVEKQIVDAYDMLADEEDKDVFYDYLLTNMMLYFDKFEDELRSDLPDVTTDEYDSEQENDEDTEASSEEFDSDSELEI